MANAMILCGAMWKNSSEQQAIARIWQRGQDKKVKIYRLQQNGIMIDAHRRRIRDEKNAHNKIVLNAVRD